MSNSPETILINLWNQYFPTDSLSLYDVSDFRHKCIRAYYSTPIYQLSYFQLIPSEYTGFTVVRLNVSLAVKASEGSIILAAIDSPSVESNINALSMGIAHSLYESKKIVEETKIKLQLINLPPKYSLNLDSITSTNINQLITAKGVIIKISNIKLIAEYCQFRCEKCNKCQIIRFANGIFDPPKKCIDPECFGKLFKQLYETLQCSSYKKIKLQQLSQSEEDACMGKLPKCVPCSIKNELVDSCAVGDTVEIVGILKAEVELKVDNNYKANKQQGKTKGIFDTFIEVNSLLKVDESRAFMSDFNSPQESSNFYSLSKEPNLFYIFMQSLCPSIYGNNVAKASITLSLFGGTDHRMRDKISDDNIHYSRPDIHILIVGEPGIGKSEMLKRIQKIAPHSFYVSGKGTTNTGLTAMISKDDLTGESVIEAGALVLSDMGICLIDEFDKMSGDQSTLTEALESQTITIAKGGMCCSLNSRCGVIACANPVGSNFNPDKPFGENINISPNILSRFDLVLVLLDKCGKIKDIELAKQVIRNRLEGVKRKHNQINDSVAFSECMAQRIKCTTSSLESQTYIQLGLPSEDNELEDKLTRILSTISEGSLLSIPTMKSYIAYAKANVFPELNDEAFQTLGAYFSELSEAYKDSSNKTTVRNLETLVRMGQARAKVELRNEVTKRDIQEIICIFNESYFGSDDGKSNSAQGLSKTKQTALFIEKLKMQAEVNGSKIFSMSDLVNIATQMKLNVGDFSTFIDKLNNASLLLFKGDNKYELV